MANNTCEAAASSNELVPAPSLAGTGYLVKSRILVAYFAAGLLLFLSNRAPRVKIGNLLLGAHDYTVSGSFKVNDTFGGAEWPHNEDQELSFLSHSGGDRQTGKFISALFRAPATLGFFVAGFPNFNGTAFWLEAAGSQERLNLKLRNDPGDQWQFWSWKLPSRWVGLPVRLIAEDNSTVLRGWLGLTLPREQTMWVRVSNSFSNLTFLLSRICVEEAFFLLPGIAFAWWMQSRYRLDLVRFVSAVVVGSAVVSYIAFWPYLLGPSFGKSTSIALFLISLLAVSYAGYVLPIRAKLLHGLLACAAIIALVTAFYSAVGFLYERSADPGIQAEGRFAWRMPPDNILPNMFANDLYNGRPVRPFLFIEWKSSDRPPLQTAAVLLQRPLWHAAQEPWDYQILGTLLQATWAGALWLLLLSLGVQRRVTLIVFAFCIFSGFFVLQTFFVWPKLLAAALFVIAVTVLRFPENRIEHCDVIDTVLGGAAIGLALLSHGGIAFSVLTLAILILIGKRLPRLPACLLGIAAFLLLMVPWSAYQRLYDPPGDRLLKWHLAGVIDRDARSFGRAFLDAYTKVPVAQIVSNKIANFRMLFGRGPWADLAQARKSGASESKVWLRWYKGGTFFIFFQMLGLLNFGFLAFLCARLRQHDAHFLSLLCSLQRLFVLSIASLVVWCLLIYIPASNVIHAGSYGTVLLLFVALGGSLAVYAPRLAYVLLAVQAVFLFPLFAITDAFVKVHRDSVFSGQADLGMGVMAVSSLIGLWIVLSMHNPAHRESN